MFVFLYMMNTRRYDRVIKNQRMKYSLLILCIIVLSGCGTSYTKKEATESHEVLADGVANIQAIEHHEDAIVTTSIKEKPSKGVAISTVKQERTIIPKVWYQGDLQLALNVMNRQHILPGDADTPDRPDTSGIAAQKHLSVRPDGMLVYENKEYDMLFTYPPEFGYARESTNIEGSDIGKRLTVGFSTADVYFDAYSIDYAEGITEGTQNYPPEHLTADMNDTQIVEALTAAHIPVENLERINIGGKKGIVFDSKNEFINTVNTKRYVIFDINSAVLDTMGAVIKESNITMIDDQEAFMVHVQE